LIIFVILHVSLFYTVFCSTLLSPWKCIKSKLHAPHWSFTNLFYIHLQKADAVSLCPADWQVFSVRIRKAAGWLPWHSGNGYHLPCQWPGFNSSWGRLSWSSFYIVLLFLKKIKSHCRTQTYFKKPVRLPEM